MPQGQQQAHARLSTWPCRACTASSGIVGDMGTVRVTLHMSVLAEMSLCSVLIFTVAEWGPGASRSGPGW